MCVCVHTEICGSSMCIYISKNSKTEPYVCSCIYAYNNDANNINTCTHKISKSGFMEFFGDHFCYR